MACPALDAAHASRLVALSIACVGREFPNKPGNVVDSDQTVRPPRELTPAFFGCFDWHSAVHGHWAMLRVLKEFPDILEAAAIRAKLNAHLAQEKMAAELLYLKADRNRTFERPYGWGWFLRLTAELAASDDPDAKRWHAAAEPVARHLSERTIAYLFALSVPIRDGTHSNTAFSLVHMLDYARVAKDSKLEAAIVARSKEFYSDDRSCPVGYEPSGEDFISPCLAEADLMRRVLAPEAFIRWYDAFMPPMATPDFSRLLAPVEVRDLKDPRIGHLIGLSLQRAWAMRGVASALPKDDPRATLLGKVARRHCGEAQRQMFESGYGGEHWLASFAIYLLTGR